MKEEDPEARFGRGFYENFTRKFYSSEEIARLNRKREVRYPEWTRAIKKFLAEMTKKNYQFEHRTEEKRLDVTWYENDELSFAFEIENNLRSIFGTGGKSGEVDKLITENASMLKVLITYVKDKDWPGRRLAEKVHQRLVKKGHKGEFLLIIGTRNLPTRWAGYLFHQRIVNEILP